MTIEEELDQYIQTRSERYGNIRISPGEGNMTMAESFSASGFLDLIERGQVTRRRGERVFDLLTNLGEWVPLIMTTNIVVTPSQVIESFQSSMRMFDRGAAYPLIWDKSMVRRNALSRMEGEFFSYVDRQHCYETNSHFWTKANSLLLAVRNIARKKTRILMCGVVKNEDYKFVMALRRHDKPIPRCLITVLMDEEFDTTAYEHQSVRQFYRSKLKETLLEANVRVERVPRTVMDALIFKPDKKYATFDELKEDGKANWKLLVKSREDAAEF